jgi:hypothetical protein
LTYPTGCGVYLNESCGFPSTDPVEELGAVSGIQSYVHPEFLLLRLSFVARHFMKMILTPHDSSNASYYARFEEPETVGYLVFRTNVTDACGRMHYQTKRWNDITSTKLLFSYAVEFNVTPAVFGMIITQNSLVDATALRVFNRTPKNASVITQEDMCDGPDPVHSTAESASAFIIGRSDVMTELCDWISLTYDPSGAPTGAPTSLPTGVPTGLPTGVPTDTPTGVPTYQPTSTPTVAPTNGPCSYSFLLYDLFGDGWKNIELAVDTDGNVTNHKVQCACEMIVVSSRSCLLTVNMISNGEAIAPWEPLWAVKVNNQTWVGDFNTTMSIEADTITVSNGPDLDPSTLENQCKACSPSRDDEGRRHPGRKDEKKDRRGRGRRRRGGDDAARVGKGNSKNDDGKKRMLGAGDDRRHGTGLAYFTLFDQFGNGWYKGGGFSSGVCNSELCPNNDDVCVEDTINLPDLLTYPKWYVMNAARTELVDFGSMCEDPEEVEGCVLSLPDGRYVYRVAGYNLEGDAASWRFCGISGVNHQELQFSMTNGKCVPAALLTAEDYCSGFKTLVFLGGSISIAGVTNDNLDDYDTNAIYLQLLAMFPNTVAVEIMSQTLDSGLLTVSFVVTVSPEDYGLDGSVSNNIETSLNMISAAAQSESQINFLNGLSTAILSSPAGAKDPLAQVSGATLSPLEVIQVQYVKKDDNTLLHPLDTVSSSSPSAAVGVHVSFMSFVALACGAVFLVAVTAFTLLRNRPVTTHTPLSDKSTHLDSSERSVNSLI